MIHQLNVAKTDIDRAIAYSGVNQLQESIKHHSEHLEEVMDLIIKSR